MHNVLLADAALPIATQMTTQKTTTMTIERAIAMNHDEEIGTNLPRHPDALPLCKCNDRNLILPP